MPSERSGESDTREAAASVSDEKLSVFVARSAAATTYSPANHTGTTNRRLVGPGALGSGRVEVIRGSIEPGSGALPHRHHGIEQVCYVIAGTARASVGGRTADLGPGDCCVFPADTEHTFTATGDSPAEILVIYSPPYAERINHETETHQ